MPEPTVTQETALRRSFGSLAVSLAVIGLLLFVPAGTLAWPRAWIFGAAMLAGILVSMAVLWRLNPEIFVARARIQAGTAAWDYIFLTLIFGGFISILPVAALDYRFGWAQAPDWVVVLGYILFALAFAGQIWPQAVNRHFEPGVRYQEDRGQTVIDTGPYAIVRHPGYISGSLLAIACALCLGSLWALLPAAVVVLALVLRTVAEEKMLRAELPGYADYTERVKYRWVPGVW